MILHSTPQHIHVVDMSKNIGNAHHQCRVELLHTTSLIRTLVHNLLTSNEDNIIM